MSQQNQTTTRTEDKKPKPAPKKTKATQTGTKSSPSKVVIGVAAAFGGSLMAVSWLGLGPVMIAGTAGYLTYQGMTRKLS